MAIKLITGPDDAERRLDRILRKALPDHPLSLIHRLLRQRKVLVNGKPADPGGRVQPNDVIQIEIRERQPDSASRPSPALLSPPPPALPEILWRRAGIVVFNKPAGLATHGDDSLDTLVTAWLAGTIQASLSFKPGPLHRLDKPTSGAIAFSETLEGARLFSRLLRERMVEKTYLAIVEGRAANAEWKDELARNTAVRKTIAHDGEKTKTARTAVQAIASNGLYTLIEAKIHTGLTHQIRAQAGSRGHPLAGDVKYGGSGTGGFFLHAWKMDTGGRIEGFPQPLIAPLPRRFLSRIQALFPHSPFSLCR